MSNLIFEENSSTLEFRLNPWDSKPFDRACYELHVSSDHISALRESVLDFILQNKMQTVTIRVASNSFELKRYIQSLGFFHAELQLDCRLVLSESMAPNRQLGTLRLAREEDRSRVKKIAGKIFLDSRFRYISNISPSKIGTRYSSWVGQLQDEFPEFAYVLEANEKIVGFFYSKPTQNDHELYAALGGIADDCRGPYGIYLYPAVMAAYYEAGIRSVVSAISANNLGALNLWAGLGTKFSETVDIYMWNSEK